MPTIAAVRFDLVTLSGVLDLVNQWKVTRSHNYITLTNPHVVMMCRRDPALRAAIRGAGLTLPDGVGIIWAATLLGLPNAGRITGASLMLHLCDNGRGYGLSHFFYGGRPGIPERLANRLGKLYPGLTVAGTLSPPFGDLSVTERRNIAEKINGAKPDIVWVGLGAPKQEVWMGQNRDLLAASALIGVGAAFDFHSGSMKRAPAWVRASGFEWIWRVAMEPRRMWRKALDNPRFLAHVLVQAFQRSSV